MKYFLLTALILTLMKTANSQTENLPVVPSPKIVKSLKGYLTLDKNVRIKINGSKEELGFTAEQIAEALHKDMNVNAGISAGAASRAAVTLSINPDAAFSEAPKSVIDQAYSLTIEKSGIRIEGRTARAVFYGAMTLIQLIDRAASDKLPLVKIIDWPDMKVRGISDDISRGQVSTPDNFKKIIRNIARYKMNVYMPYLEDMIKFPQYPGIGKGRGALSADEIKELVAYAKKYFIDVIPIFQTLGHYENILVQKKYLKYAEFPGAASLNVSNDSTYIFLESMLKEVFKLFPSEYFHMGADESFDVGLGASKYMVDKFGIAKVHADHYQRIYDICKKYGKKVMMYGDIILRHPEILKMIPKDITIVDWHYRPDTDYPSAKIFNEAGFNYCVSPSVWNFSTMFPTNVNALPNIKYIVKAGLENNSRGMINSNWGDFGAETFKELLYFGYAWSAQCSWNFKESNLNVFSQNYFRDFFGTSDERIPQIYESLSDPLNQVTWNEFWRHPLLDFNEPVWWEPRVSPTAKAEWMEWTLPQVLKDINAVEPDVKKNKDQLDILRFIVKMDEWYISKMKTEFLLHDKSYLKTKDNSSHVIRMIDKNISSLHNLRNEYDNIWLKYYDKANLNMINDKFDRLAAYFNEIKDSLKKGDDTLYSPLIPSKWIYVSDGTDRFALSAEFERTIKIDNVPDKACLQLMGDTYARLYINGKYVGEVYARRTLSLTVEYHRVKYLNIKKYLVKGENTFLVKVKNFNDRGAAGLNIDSYFSGGGKITNINTGEDAGKDLWKGKAGNEGWGRVTVRNYPFQIIAPDFNTRRPSWIER